MKVELVRWPAEEAKRIELAAAEQPRLLLVEASESPPNTPAALEDWIRLPADEIDLRARVSSLLEAKMLGDRPTLDEDGLLRFRDRWIAVPPIEASLVRELLDKFGTVVSREQLTKAGWPQVTPGRNALDVHVLRLRRRIGDLGLAIRTVRSRGYLLEIEGAGAIRSAFVK